MLYLGWIFLWMISRERMKGFHISDCSTEKPIWTYYARSEEEFLLFCDLPGLQKSHFFHRSQLSPTQVPERVPCNGSKDLSDVQWYLQPPNGYPLREVTKNHPHIKSALHFSTIRMSDAGSYICRPRIRYIQNSFLSENILKSFIIGTQYLCSLDLVNSPRNPQDDACCIKMVLEVKSPQKTSCSGPGYEQELLLGSIASISCPTLNCLNDTQSPEVTWYQDGELLLEERSNPMQLGEIYDYHSGTYVCDYIQSVNASSWTVRAVVQVKTYVKDTNFKPNILEPDKDTLEVEFGKPLTLNCKVRFGFEKDFNPIVKWYIEDAEQKCNLSQVKHEVIQCALSLKEVTQNDLRKNFTCFAQNSKGNDTLSIQLKEKKGVVFIYILLGIIMTLVGVLTASALLYLHWIEIVLLYRTCQNKDETLGDKKEFDAFVSYAKWSSLESEFTSSLSEENLAVNLLPEVLENKHGYTLCLFERDVIPGGVYTEDIISIIKKSRRGIFILSPNYINGPSIFELQAAVNLALDDKTLKLILINFCSFEEPESLPHLVKKALCVLPTITWRGLKSVPPSSRFWTQIRYHMPVKTSRISMKSSQNYPNDIFIRKDSVSQKPLGGAPNLRNSGNGCSKTSPPHKC